ncbi:unnamed protein product, partial [Natator depressus]
MENRRQLVLGWRIPPYNALRDPHVAAYFTTKPVPPLLQRTGQVILQHMWVVTSCFSPQSSLWLDTTAPTVTEETLHLCAGSPHCWPSHQLATSL